MDRGFAVQRANCHCNRMMYSKVNSILSPLRKSRLKQPSIIVRVAKQRNAKVVTPEIANDGLYDESLQQTKTIPFWSALPSRYKLLLATNMAFIICNMDKINMSIAIIPMAQDFGWSPAIAGLVQSAFFWGYFLAQLPSGYVSSTLGGRKMLPAGVTLFSLATAALPMLAATAPGLCLARSAVGFGVGFTPVAATDIVARVIPKEERSRAVSFIFSGLHVGSIIGLLASPALIRSWGWQSLFVTFGMAGLVWSLWFENIMASMMAEDPDVAKGLTGVMVRTSVRERKGGASSSEIVIPWRGFIRSRSVQALMFTHFCLNWFHYTMLAWLPTYFTQTLHVDLMHAATTALLPPLAGIVASSAAGPTADALISRGVSVPVVRKLAQNVAFLIPALCLAIGAESDDSTVTVASITAALGISSFSLAGLYCTHADLSPKYASALLGLTNTAGAVPGIVGVTTVGLLFEMTGSWSDALFLPSAALCLAGALVFTIFGRNDPEDFDLLDEPFGWEKHLPRLPWRKD